MSLFTLVYKGYSIHGTAAKPEVTYQSPAWPADPRIVKAPSLETAKRWIREELRRLKKHDLKNAVYLAQAREKIGNRSWCQRWRIINADKDDLVDRLFNPCYFNTKDDAREFADKHGWALLEHFDY